jgi:hypothetical protein
VSNVFLVIPENKPAADFSVFLHTEKYLYDITKCKQPSTFLSLKRGINLHGVLLDAKRVAPEYFADLLSKGASIIFKKRKKREKRRAASKSTRRAPSIRKEGAYIQ